MNARKILIVNFAIIIFVSYFNFCDGQRRISNGRETEGDRSYMVYFVKSEQSESKYEGWLCGGALITEIHILTSAACLMDTQQIYAIAGYLKYVPSDLIEQDDCTRTKKKRVVKTCVPKRYELGFKGTPAWGNPNDIGLAIVESPYDFNDTSYYYICSYPPQPIAVNFGLKSQQLHVDAVALGWGHHKKLRQVYHQMDHNAEYLREASVSITRMSECIEKFRGSESMTKVSLAYWEHFICTNGKGDIDSNGNVVDYGKLVENCALEEDYNTLRNGTEESNATKLAVTGNQTDTTTETPKSNVTAQNQTVAANTNTSDYYDYDKGPLEDTAYGDDLYGDENDDAVYENDDAKSNYDLVYPDKTRRQNDVKKEGPCRRMMRRQISEIEQSICQNDHGGPLVTWIGNVEVIIGVAMTSAYSYDYSCIPPNLFVSTAYHPYFIKCGIKHKYDSDDDFRRCAEKPKDGDGIHTTEVKW